MIKEADELQFSEREVHSIEKLLESLPGAQADIYKELKMVERDPSRRMAKEREVLVEGYRVGGALKPAALVAIRKRIANLEKSPWQSLSEEVIANIFSFLAVRDTASVRLSCQANRRIVDDKSYWLRKLENDFNFSSNDTIDLERPDVVYKRFNNLSALIRDKAIELLGASFALNMLDYKTEQQFKNYFENFCTYLGSNRPKFYQLYNHDGFFLLGHTQLAELLIKKGLVFCDLFTLNEAAQSGSLKLVQSLIETKGLKADSDTLRNAAKSGSVKLFRYLVENQKLVVTEEVIDSCIESDSLELFQYLESSDYLVTSYGLQYDSILLAKAARHGSYKLYSYLIKERKYEVQADNHLFLALNPQHRMPIQGSFEIAHLILEKTTLIPNPSFCALLGSVEMMRIHCERKNITPQTQNKILGFAIQSGSVKLVRYLVDNLRMELSEDLLSLACKANKLEIMRYFTGEKTFACRADKLDIVRYLIEEKGMAVSTAIIQDSVYRCSNEVIAYFVTYAKKFPEATKQALYENMLRASISYYVKRFETIKFLCEHEDFSQAVITVLEENPQAHTMVANFYLSELKKKLFANFYSAKEAVITCLEKYTKLNSPSWFTRQNVPRARTAICEIEKAKNLAAIYAILVREREELEKTFSGEKPQSLEKSGFFSTFLASNNDDMSLQQSGYYKALLEALEIYRLYVPQDQRTSAPSAS